MLEAKYKCGNIRIDSDGGLFHIYLNNEELPLVTRAVIEYLPRELPVLSIDILQLPDTGGTQNRVP